MSKAMPEPQIENEDEVIPCVGCGDPDCDFDCDGNYDGDPDSDENGVAPMSSVLVRQGA